MNYIISGVALTGNKGASGMAEALVQNVAKQDDDAKFYIMSYYPKTDATLGIGDNCEIIDGSPKNVVILFFLCLWWQFASFLRLPRFARTIGKTLKAVEGCDYWLDASGISFVDGREKFLIFNILSIFPGLIFRKKIIKVSQALGPFTSFTNRVAAKAVLPRLELICARGEETFNHLKALGLNNIRFYPDITFSLQIQEDDFHNIKPYLPDTDKRIVGISPSQVMYGLCEKKHIDYLALLASHIEMLFEQGNEIVIFPHSVRINTQSTHNNDLPVIEKLIKIIPSHIQFTLVEKDLSAAELRALIEGCDLLVASRFHALISALAVKTPVLVLGWSHKYREVLKQFGLERYALTFDNMEIKKLNDLYLLMKDKEKEIKLDVEKALGVTVEQCQEFYSELVPS